MLLYIAAMFIFGTIGVLRRLIPLSSGMLAFARGVLGTLFLCLYMVVRKKKFRHNIGMRNFILLMLSGFAIGFNWMLLFEAYNHTTVAVATLCYYMAPVMVVLVSPLLLHEHLGTKKIVCVVVAIIGMVFVSGVLDGSGAGNSDISGILYGLGAAALYASVVITNKKVHVPDALEKTIIQLASASVIMIPYLLITEDFSQIELSTVTVLLVLLLGIVHTGITYLMFFKSMENLKGQTVAIFSYVDPVTSLILSGIVLGETMSVLGIIGAVMILGAAAVSELV